MSVIHRFGNARFGFMVDLDHDYKQITVSGKADRFRSTLGMLLIMPPCNSGDWGDDSINQLYEIILRRAEDDLDNLQDDGLPFQLELRAGDVRVEFGALGRWITVTGLYDRRTAKRVELIQDLYDLAIPASADDPVIDEYRQLLAEIGAVA